LHDLIDGRRGNFSAGVCCHAAAVASARTIPSRSNRDATAEFQAGPGLTVTQITSAPLGSQFSYYDINFYAPEADRFIYNTVVQVLKGPKNKGGNAESQPKPLRATRMTTKTLPAVSRVATRKRRSGAWRASDQTYGWSPAVDPRAAKHVFDPSGHEC